MASGSVPIDWQEYRKEGEWAQKDGQIIEEALISIYVNGIELATIMASPVNQDLLALGFMKNEGLIKDISEIAVLYVSKAGCCVDIWLTRPFEKPKRKIVTSGCGGGVTFTGPEVSMEPLRSKVKLHPERLRSAFRKLQTPDSLYARSRGVHAAGLLNLQTEQLTVVMEDVGRHNTIDKVTGFCLQEGTDTQDQVLLVTGRISSEMMRKAALMGCPIVASRTSPTSLSVEMGKAWGITLVGYVRSGSMRVYSYPERLYGI